MNELLARAGSLFLAPAPSLPTPVAVAPSIADLAGVLARPADLACVAGGVAAALRRGSGARAVIVCSPGPVRGRAATPSAVALARRLAARELPAVAAGALCRVTLGDDPESGVRDAWRVAAAATGAPVVVALARRCDDFDALLAQADQLTLGARAGDDSAYAELALASLGRLGPSTALVTVPSGIVARRTATLGLSALRPAAALQEAPA